jgi:uncharacterized repeat protein (TIGR01451 family)
MGITASGIRTFMLLPRGNAPSAARSVVRSLRRGLGAVAIAVCGFVSAGAIAADPVVNAVFLTSGITTTIAGSNVTTIQFTISNQAGDLAANVSFTETLPAGLLVAATPNKGGTCAGAAAATTANAGSTTITVSNLAIPAGASSCTVTVDVRAAGSPAGAGSGNYNGSCATFPAAFTTLPGNISATTNVSVDPAIQSCVTVGTYPSLESPADRFGGKLNCTANDVSLGNINVVGTTQCVFGQPVTLSLTGDLSVTANNRYDVGIYFAQDGKDLQKQSTAGGAASASVVTLTGAVPPFIGNQDADACFDSNSGLTNGITLPVITLDCLPNPTTGKLDLVSLVSWSQQSNNNCGGPQDVVVGENNASSKCTNSTTATGVTVVGQINNTKVIVGGVATSFDFTAANTTTPANAPSPTAFPLANGATQLVQTAGLTQAGEHYLITETQDPAYILSSIVCTDSAGAPAANVAINLANGTVDANMSTANGIVNCTYTNTVRPAVPAIIKAFDPTSILSGGTTVLTYTISSPANAAAEVVTFTDTLPSGLFLANGTVGGSCLGYTITDASDTALAAGSLSVKVTNLTINPGTSCTISVNVTNKPGQVNSSCDQLPSAFTNGPGNVTVSTNLANLIAPSCVVVSTLPGLTKSFNPTTFPVNGTSTLTFTIDNSQAGAIDRNGVSFTDLLPSGLILFDGIDSQTGTCTFTITDNNNAALAAGATSVKVTNLSILAGTTCTIAVTVTNVPYQTNASCAQDPPAFTNTSGSISGLNNLVNNVVPSCVTVTPLTATLTKSFSPNSFTIGGFTTLTFTLTNPATNNPAQTVSFTDNLPSGLQVAAAPTVVNGCGGTVTAVAGSTSIAVSNAVVAQSTAAPSTCTIAVNVTNAPAQVNSSCGQNPPAFTNAAGNIANPTNVNNGVQPSCVTVLPLVPTLTKSFSPNVINYGGTTTLTFTVTNPAGNAALSNVGFVDTLPSGLVVANPAAVGGTCSNAAAATTATSGTGTISVSNLNVPAGASACTVTVNVTNAPGQVNPSCAQNPQAFTNTSANVAVTNVLDGVQPSCVVVNTFTLSISKVASTSVVAPGSPLSFTIVVTNNGPSPADGAVITDPAIAFYTVNAVSCPTTTGGATCPTPLNVTALQTTGMTVATFPAGASITLVLDGISSLSNGSLINTVTVTPPAGIPGVAAASASAAVAVPIGVIPTLSSEVLAALLLLLGFAGAFALRRSGR